ncbi:MAG: helix-turn-helix domain-containing protein [Aquiluna sp.]
MTDWTFISHHGHVLLAISRNPDVKIDELSEITGVTTRSIVNILKDLEVGGYLTKTKSGRNNHYEINLNSKLRHTTSSNRTVGDLVSSLGSVGI